MLACRAVQAARSVKQTKHAHTSSLLSGTPTAPLLIVALKGVNPACVPMSATHSCNSATASSFTPYLRLRIERFDALAVTDQFAVISTHPVHAAGMDMCIPTLCRYSTAL